jgi:hypothetical protein
VQRLLSTLKLLEKYCKKSGGKKSVVPNGIPDENLKLGGEAMTPYLSRLLKI